MNTQNLTDLPPSTISAPLYSVPVRSKDAGASQPTESKPEHPIPFFGDSERDKILEILWKAGKIDHEFRLITEPANPIPCPEESSQELEEILNTKLVFPFN